MGPISFIYILFTVIGDAFKSLFGRKDNHA